MAKSLQAVNHVCVHVCYVSKFNAVNLHVLFTVFNVTVLQRHLWSHWDRPGSIHNYLVWDSQSELRYNCLASGPLVF